MAWVIRHQATIPAWSSLYIGYSIAEHAECLLDMVESLQLEGFVVFGHSAGGAIAVQFAAEYLERIDAVVLSEPNLDAGGGFFSRFIASQTLADYQQKGHWRQIQECIETGNNIWAGTMRVSSPEAVHKLSTSLMQGSLPSWRELLISFQIPRMVLFGEYSLPDDDFQNLPQSGIQVAMIPEAGHSMLWENPTAVARAIADFIASR